MTYILILLSTLFFLTACGNNTLSSNIEETSINPEPAVPTTPDPVTPTTPDPVTPTNSNKLGKLQISADKRMIQYDDGTGFFWMGDTAWEMPIELNREEVDLYMQDRKNKGFSVIQISAVQSKNFLYNAYGDRAFTSNYSQPNEVYWKHIDYIIESAKKNNLYIALLPSWHYALTTISEAKLYGRWISERYQNKDNIIWVVGGDSNADLENKKSVWNALGNAINNVVGSNQLITYHPSGASSSSQWFHNETWLDFNMIQSGHCAKISFGNDLIKVAYKKSQIKPVLDGEPRYETIEECFKRGNYRFQAKDIRQITYSQLFSGAFGHTYGHHSIWQKYKNGDNFIAGEPTKEWQDALNDEGARHMAHVAKLMRSRPILGRVPDQSMIQSGTAIATRGAGYAFLYLPKGGSVTINLGKISGNNVKAWWYNPRTGEATAIATYPNSGIKNFSTVNEDMVLVLDDVAKGYETPGLL